MLAVGMFAAVPPRAEAEAAQSSQAIASPAIEAVQAKAVEAPEGAQAAAATPSESAAASSTEAVSSTTEAPAASAEASSTATSSAAPEASSSASATASPTQSAPATAEATKATETTAATTPAPTTTAPVKKQALAAAAPAALAARAAGDPLQCTPGVVYGLSNQGLLQEVSATGVVTPIGQAAAIDPGPPAIPGVSATAFNGLGIGLGGREIYAYARTAATAGINTIANLYKFDVTANKWTNIGVRYETNNDGMTGGLIAGAVDLKTGQFFFGGYAPDGKTFWLWKYTPGGAVKFLGKVDTSAGSVDGQTTNGDIAFDSSGNLFIIRGSGTSTTIFSVKAANVAAANGGAIVAAGSTGVTTVGSVNGAAFDSNGLGYLGNATSVTSYTMPAWTNPSTVVSAGFSSADLATCSSPATVTLEKNITGRFAAGDQFTLSMNQGASVLGTSTTSGSTTGVQDARVGPLPVVAGSTLTFAETAASGSLANYASSYQCTADGVAMAASAVGSSGSVTIPPTAKEVICTLTNTPRTATLSINKQVQDVNGNNAAPQANWTMGSVPSIAAGSPGTFTAAPVATTQLTNGSGNTNWSLTFSNSAGIGVLNISETQKTGFQFVSGSCVVTSVGGGTRTVTLTSELATPVTGIVPGDAVACQYVNKPISVTVTVNKNWVVNGTSYANGSQPTGISATLGLSPAGGPAGTPAFGQLRSGFAQGQSVAISETTTIDPALFPGCVLSSATIAGPGITGTPAIGNPTNVSLPGPSNVYTVTNTVTCQTLTVIKSVTNTYGGALAPADWDNHLFAQQGAQAKLTFKSSEKKFVATGSYVISEDVLPGYAQSGIACTGGTLAADGKTIPVAAGANVVCTITNADQPGSVTWGKTDAAGDRLAGSEWTLTGPNNFSVAVTDCVAAAAANCTGPDKDPAKGSFKVTGLKWGNYSLVETKAPAGFRLDPTPHTFAITAAALNFPFTAAFVNQQVPPVVLPLTGGLGSQAYLFGSLAVALVALIAALLHRRSRRKSLRV